MLSLLHKMPHTIPDLRIIKIRSEYLSQLQLDINSDHDPLEGETMNYKIMKAWAQAIIVHINVSGEYPDDKYLKDLVWHLQNTIAEEES